MKKKRLIDKSKKIPFIERITYLCPRCKKEIHMKAKVEYVKGYKDKITECYNCEIIQDGLWQTIKIGQLLKVRIKRKVKNE
jgi:ribosomal protein L37AE/L43A